MIVNTYIGSNTGFVTNVNDFCSTGAALGFSNFAGNLGAGETCVEDSGSPGVSGAGCLVAGPVAQQYDDPLIAGEFNLFLDAPGRFTFGIYGRDKNQVYRRELY